MSRLKELRDSLPVLHETAKAKNDEIKKDTKPEERARIEAEFEAIMADFDKAEAEIKRIEALDSAEARQAEQLEAAQRAARPNLGTEPGTEVATKHPEYRGVFVDALRYGFAGLTEEQRNVFNAVNGLVPRDKLDPELRALAAGTDSAGGYTIPQGFIPQIEKTMAIWGPMLRADVIDLMTTDSGNGLEMPTINDTASRGDLLAENAAAVDDGGNDFVFGTVAIGAYNHNSEIQRIPFQLLQDSAFDFERRVVPELFGERMARTLNDKLTIGDGSSKPQGIVNGAGAGVTATAVAAITSDELIDLQHTVNPAYRLSPSCGFMFNDTTLKGFRKLKDLEGRYIWQRADLALGTPATLLDHPYWINPSMVDAAAATKPVLFGDMKKYLVRKVRQDVLFVFREKYMNQGQLGFMAYGRYDGRMLNNAAIKAMTMAAS